MQSRVLLAEDEANIAESLRFILEREGFDVIHVTDGSLVLDAAQRADPDAVILDVMMPKLSGFEVLKRIRASDTLQKLPVLILTAKGQAEDRRTAEALGADAFVTKPFSNKDIVSEIKRLTGQ